MSKTVRHAHADRVERRLDRAARHRRRESRHSSPRAAILASLEG